jgi:hypothetical protein
MSFSQSVVSILAASSLAAGSASAVTLMVNEYSNHPAPPNPVTKFTSNEYIEFVVGENSTAAQLAALTFGDTNNATSQIRSVFRFDQATLDQALANAGITEFLAGTVIVVKGPGLGSQDLNYNPLTTNTGNADAWNIELVAGLGFYDHSETLINGSYSIENTGDVVWVSTSFPPTSNTDVSGFISALGHDPAPGAIANAVTSQFGSGVIWNGNLTGTNSVISNTGGPGTPVASGGGASTASRGTTNGGMNDIWVTSLREYNFVTVPEPSRVMLMLAGAIALVLRRRRQR